MRCHFVYSVPFSNSTLNRVKRKLIIICNRLGFALPLVLNRHPTDDDFKLWPKRSPFENTKHIYKALAAQINTELYHLSEIARIDFEANDIFIGHPYFPHNDTRYGVTEIAAMAKTKPKIFALISPLHCDITVKTSHINKEFLDDIDRMIPHADKLFSIMGQYWWDQWDKSPYSHWKHKMIRLDMAVDTSRYPRVKRRFNKPGKRGYLFIGGSWDARKGSDFFSQLMIKLGNYPCGWIGDGPEITGVTHVSGARDLTFEFMEQIAQDFDFFVSPATADPNPTTILEAMSWGFPVICTPQSGYYETEYRRNIYLDDLDKSVAILKELQLADERLLQKMADQARYIVETEYTWDKFCKKIISELNIAPTA